jgi:hypothetical protein
MRPAARIVHRTRGRIRLKVPERRRDLAWFLELYDHLRRLPGVEEVQADPVTGSALLRVEAGREDQVVHAIGYSTLIDLQDEEPPAASPVLAAAAVALHGARSLDRHIRELSAGTLDLRSVALLMATALMLRRPIMGAVLAGALSLLFLPRGGQADVAGTGPFAGSPPD